MPNPMQFSGCDRARDQDLVPARVLGVENDRNSLGHAHFHLVCRVVSDENPFVIAYPEIHRDDQPLPAATQFAQPLV
ncbi:hypothetical protein [Nocardia sp. GAS34]|uniref:hypothetical protein n=1 Tax=unclassified Nocardia TaxID=2637762 RepID=UPI003D20CEB4